MFLDGHVCEVNKHVVQLTGAGGVLNCAEPAKAKLVPEDQTNSKHSLFVNIHLLFYTQNNKKAYRFNKTPVLYHRSTVNKEP